MSLVGEESKQTNIIDLFISSEYSLTNYSALQAVINYMEDRYKPTSESIGRFVTPNDLHTIMAKAAVIYYLVCKKSSFHKIALETTSEDELRTKIITPICGFLADTLSQTMQSTKAIGSLISNFDLANRAITILNNFHPETDEEAKAINDFTNTIAPEILTPTIKQILNGNEWLERTDHKTISKLIYKTCLFTYLTVSINSLVKDIIAKKLSTGVFLNILMTASHSISTLAIEEQTSAPEVEFLETCINITHAAAFALCIAFESKDADEHPAYKFIPNAFSTVANSYNMMVEQVNTAMATSEEKIEALVLISPEEVTAGQDKIKEMIAEDIKSNQDPSENLDADK